MAGPVVVPKASVVGSPEQISTAVVVAREYAAHVEHDARPLARSYRRLREGDAHLKWRPGEPLTWEAFCREALGYEGGFLDAVDDGVRALEGDGYDGVIPRQRALEAAETLGALPGVGRPRKGMNHTFSQGDPPRGSAYNARRLKRDAPDVYPAYKAGEYPSAYAAAIAAGIAKQRVSVDLTPEGFARVARNRLSPEQIAELVRLLRRPGMSAEPDQEWRTVYGTKRVLFVEGRGVGDYYQAGDGVFRVRLWPHYRLQGGAEQLVLSKSLAEETLVEMFRWRKQDEAAG